MPVAFPYIVTFLVPPDGRKRLHVRAYNAVDAGYQACVEMAQLEGGTSATLARIEPECAPELDLSSAGAAIRDLFAAVRREGEKPDLRDQ